jgi:uncharacterized protein (TIGR00369 family)
MRKIPRYLECFVCGRENAAGLDVQFFRDGDKVVCDWLPAEKHLGYRDRVHGGVVASILDEALSWAPASEYQRMCFSIELCIKYRRPIPSGEAVRVEAELVDCKPRAAKARGRILNAAGQVCAEATGVFLPLKDGKTEEILPALYIEGEERKVTLEDL